MKKQGGKGNQPLTSVLPLSLGSFSPIKSGMFKCISVSQLGGKHLPKRRERERHGAAQLLGQQQRWGPGGGRELRRHLWEEHIGTITARTSSGFQNPPRQQSQVLLSGAPGEYHAHGSSGGKSRWNNYTTLLCFHHSRAHANICLLVHLGYAAHTIASLP